MPVTLTFPKIRSKNKAIWITAGVIAAGLVVSLLFWNMWARAAVVPISGEQLSYAAGPAIPASPSATTQAAPVLEMHIANDGLVFLQGARVDSINGTTIQVETDFPGGNFVWMVQTNSGTQFPTPTASNTALSDVHVGDIVDVTGMLAGGSGQLAVNAQFVREEQ
jgi:hypothetical protein